MTLGQRIQAHRTRLGLSQEGLGEKLGVSRQAVSKWEADGAVPDTNKLIALSKLFGISLNELLQVDGPPPAGERPPVRRSKAKAVLAVALVLALLALAGTTLSLAARVTALEEQVAALEQRSQSLDPAELVAGWDFGVINDNEAGQTVKFQVTVARYDPEEEPEVFFLLSGLGVGAKREPAERGRKAGAGRQAPVRTGCRRIHRHHQSGAVAGQHSIHPLCGLCQGRRGVPPAPGGLFLPGQDLQRL